MLCNWPLSPKHFQCILNPTTNRPPNIISITHVTWWGQDEDQSVHDWLTEHFKRQMVHGTIISHMLATSKETCTTIIALHKKGLTVKFIAESKITSRLLNYQELQGERFNCYPASTRTPVLPNHHQCKTCSRMAEKQVWVLLHPQWGEGFQKNDWCNEGLQRSHFSPVKTSRPNWSSAESTGTA